MSAITTPQLRRLEELSRAGLSDAGIAVVLNVDHGLSLSRGQVRYYRRRYTTSRGPRRNPVMPWESA